MFKSPAVNGIALILLGVAFVVAFGILLRERFAVGDIYSEYSTYRTDPRGSTAFYRAINRLPGLGSERNIVPIGRVNGATDKTVVFNGIDPFGTRSFSLDSEAHRLAEEGSRVVLTFSPRHSLPLGERQRMREANQEDEEPEPEINTERSDDSDAWSRRARKLSATLEFEEVDRGDLPRPVNLANEEWGVSRYPELWLSGLYFEPEPETWTVLLEVNERPVLMERQVGEGSVVLMSDAYWLSNEALVRHRRPEFLAWMIGPARQVVFDETHLGTARRVGIMWLLREFGFTTAILVLFAAGLLFVWRNMAAFPPRESLSPEVKGVHFTGRDATKGLVNLLQRSIPRRNILAACWKEWKDAQSPVVLERKAEAISQVDRLIESEGRFPTQERLVATYRQIDQLIHKENQHSKPKPKP